jgi:5,10-methylenetetrahydromethanopterin reductase
MAPGPDAAGAAPWPARLGVTIEGRESPAEVAALARAAEAGGAGTFWVASHLFLRDPITTALVALQATTRLRVALMAMSPFAMHPVHIAMAAGSLAELHPGRIVLCLGSGAPADRDAAGIAAMQLTQNLREAVILCRALLAGEAVRFEGEVFRLAQGRGLAAPAPDVAIVLAASQPRMLRLAGEVADGVLLSGGVSVPFLRDCLARVEEGARGRRVARLGLVYAVPVAAGADRAAVLRPVRRRLAQVLRGAHHAPNLAAAGTALDQARLLALSTAGDWDGACALVNDDVVARHAVTGDAAALRAGVAAYHAAGLDEVALAGLNDPAAIATVLGALG